MIKIISSVDFSIADLKMSRQWVAARKQPSKSRIHAAITLNIRRPETVSPEINKNKNDNHGTGKMTPQFSSKRPFSSGSLRPPMGRTNKICR